LDKALTLNALRLSSAVDFTLNMFRNLNQERLYVNSVTLGSHTVLFRRTSTLT